MAIVVTCTACGRKLRAPDRLAGSKGRCPSCGGPLDLPAAKASGDLKEALDELGDSWAFTSPIRKRAAWPWVVGAAVGGLVTIVVLVVLMAAGGGAASSVAGPAVEQPAAAPVAPVSPKPAAQPSPAQSKVVAQPSAVQAAPANQPAAPKEESAPSGSPVPPGPVQGPAAAQLQAIVNDWLYGLMSPDAAGVAAMRPGRKVEMKRGLRSYLGVTYRPSNVVVAHGKVDVRELYVLTTDAWQLSDDFYLPAQTCIMVKNGAYEVTSLAALKAAAADEETYIKNALAEIDAAVAQQDLQRAKQVLAEAQAKFPGASALQKRAAGLRVEMNSVLIKVENRAIMPLSLRLVQGGAAVVARAVEPGETVAVRVPRGVYLGEWSGQAASGGGMLSVEHSETWVFTLAGGAGVAGMESELRWIRTAR